MPTTDPIADMLTRIRNANTAVHDQVDIPASKLKEQIARVLKREGFIKDYQVLNTGVQGVIRVTLKYAPDRSEVIAGLKRVSRPGLRRYVGAQEIPVMLSQEGAARFAYSVSVGPLAEVEVLVPSKHLQAAQQVIKDYWLESFAAREDLEVLEPPEDEETAGDE